MTRISIRHLLAIVVLAASAAGCTSSTGSKSTVQRPPTQGLYVVFEGKVGRLDDAPEKVLKTWPIRSNLGPDIEFVIHHPAIAESTQPVGQLVALRQVAYVRANIATSGTVRKNKKSEWIVANLDPLNVPARVLQDSRDPTLLRVIPSEPLTPGLYALTLRTGRTAVTGRFGVEWSKSDKKQYAREHCVDRYLSTPVLYRPCDERDGVEQGALKVQALNVSKAIVNSVPALVIEGRVKNTSAKRQTLPTMLAVLNDKQGKELQRWTFAPAAKELSPGTSVAFRTTAAAPPRNTAGVAILLSQ
jgi:Protein of unknown function (DUF3426)